MILFSVAQRRELYSDLFAHCGMRIGEDEFGMKIGFSSKSGVGFNLLGMNVFDRYRVIFDNRAKKVVFERYE